MKVTSVGFEKKIELCCSVYNSKQKQSNKPYFSVDLFFSDATRCCLNLIGLDAFASSMNIDLEKKMSNILTQTNTRQVGDDS